MNRCPTTSRRSFVGASAGALAGASILSCAMADDKEPKQNMAKLEAHVGRRRVGGVAYSYQYSIGLFSYSGRRGERFDAFRYLAAEHEAGSEVVQLYHQMLDPMGDEGLKRLRAQAEAWDISLEVLGGNALSRWTHSEASMHTAAALGSKIFGATLGMFRRGSLGDWEAHTNRCVDRLRELAPLAKSLGLTIAVENHLDFSADEMRMLIERVDSPQVRVLFDVGNFIGTLDDPIEAADTLGPLTVATHYKDFAIEEVSSGFRFCMVPLGCGSLQLRTITKQLLKHVGPNVKMSIELLNGQNFEVNWLKNSFWSSFKNKPARQLAATLRHVRAKPIEKKEHLFQDEVDRLPHGAHMELEQRRNAQCVAYLKELLNNIKIKS